MRIFYITFDFITKIFNFKLKFFVPSSIEQLNKHADLL